MSLRRHYQMMEMFAEMLDELLDAFDEGLKKLQSGKA